MLSSLCIQTLSLIRFPHEAVRTVRTHARKADSATRARVCSHCGVLKAYNPDAPKYTKASGFNGTVCWDCRLELNNVKYADRKRN
jgi:hypothetical protein